MVDGSEVGETSPACTSSGVAVEVKHRSHGRSGVGLEGRGVGLKPRTRGRSGVGLEGWGVGLKPRARGGLE